MTAIHRHLCICLCLAEIVLLAGLDATQNKAVCGMVAGVLHFLFLAVFAWMLVEGIQIYFMVVKVRSIPRQQVLLYCRPAFMGSYLKLNRLVRPALLHAHHKQTKEYTKGDFTGTSSIHQAIKRLLATMASFFFSTKASG